MEDKYLFESFEADASDFDARFSRYLNDRYQGGWKCKGCQFEGGDGKRTASCLFKRS